MMGAWDEVWWDESDFEIVGLRFYSGVAWWYTRDGETMRVADMTDGHLHNSIALFEREHLDPETLKVLHTEMAARHHE